MSYIMPYKYFLKSSLKL